jgi:hypothetical protein
VYVDPHTKKSTVEARRGGGAKEAQQWTKGSETGTKKIGRNCKKKNSKNIKTDRKVIQQNTKTKTEMEEAVDEEKGWGASGLGTSSKLLEPGAKGMWGGGMAEATSPPLLLRRSGGWGGGSLAKAKEPYIWPRKT